MSRFAKFANTEFKPFKHAYTLYTVEGKHNSIYVESNTYGDEKAMTYHFNDAWEIEDTEGSACFSDDFETMLINHLSK